MAHDKDWLTNWVTTKRRVALSLANGECSGSYGDAMLILCSVLSALAAYVWPGVGKDRKRFVELLKEFAPANLSCTKISIPLLVGHLRIMGKDTEMQQVKKSFLNIPNARLLTGKDIDKAEKEFLTVYNALNLVDIRECSYANVLYREVRSGYVHEYKTGTKADSSFFQDTNDISYLNWLHDPDRHIHFPINWVAEVVVSIANIMVLKIDQFPLEEPKTWWIDG